MVSACWSEPHDDPAQKSNVNGNTERHVLPHCYYYFSLMDVYQVNPGQLASPQDFRVYSVQKFWG